MSVSKIKKPQSGSSEVFRFGRNNMPCYSPLKGYYKREDGQRKFTVSGKEAPKDAEFGQVACGQCIGCRKQRAQDWAIRCAHEMMLYEQNCFITLTYAYEPELGSLVKKDFQDFMKRLRQTLWRKYNKKISYYMCGEYGSDKERPHYHAIIFGHDFSDDREPFFMSKGQQVYKSSTLQKAWDLGHVSVMDATIGTAAYVSKYITKKHTGQEAVESYAADIDAETGELLFKLPEYNNMSLKPAIGLRWLKRYYSTELQKGFLTHDGTKFRIPKYYKQQLEKISPSIHEEVMQQVAAHATSLDLVDDDYERLLQREQHAILGIQKEMRNLSGAD